MSMSSTTFSCDKCEYVGSSMRVWGDFAYLIDGHEVPLERVLGWCSACQKLEAIEAFDDAEECHQRIDETFEEIQRWAGSAWTDLLRFVFPGRRRAYQSELNTLRGWTLRLHLIHQRQGTARCLTCGSSDVLPFTGDTELEFDEHTMSYIGEKKTGFKHPGCGGDLWVKECPMRWHLKFTPRRYDASGSMIEIDKPL